MTDDTPPNDNKQPDVAAQMLWLAEYNANIPTSEAAFHDKLRGTGLEAYAEYGKPFPMLRHPLCYMVPFLCGDGELKQVLETIAQKKARIAKLRRQRKWDRALFLYERPWRFSTLLEWAPRWQSHARATWWAAFGEVWTDSENVWQHVEAWRYLWATATREEALLTMGTEDHKWLAELQALGKPLVVYRGATPIHERMNGVGLSWTTDMRKAKWFARRFNERGKVSVALVPLEEVRAVFVGRGESEVVPNPAYMEAAEIKVL